MSKKEKNTIILEFEKCWKLNCTAPCEVYKSHINFFGDIINIEFFDSRLKEMKDEVECFKKAIEIWHREFEIKK